MTYISLVLSESLDSGQNRFDNIISGLRNWLRGVYMSINICRGSLSSFFSETGEHRQTLQDTVVLYVFEIKLLAANDITLSSSRTTCSISATYILLGIEVKKWYFHV